MNADEIMEELTTAAMGALDPYFRRNKENFTRVGRLIGAAGREDCEDILRAAVVFLHASTEDFLRLLASAYLPRAREAALNRIPLAGSTSSRPEKFPLGRLAAHSGKSVAELIQESVDGHMCHETFNNPEEVASLLETLGFYLPPVRECFVPLGEMMRRRHDIVHRADFTEAGVPTKINAEQVMGWTDKVVKFVAILMSQVCNREGIDAADRLIRRVVKERGFEI